MKRVGKEAIWDMTKDDFSALSELISMLYLVWQQSPLTKGLPIPNLEVTQKADGKVLFGLWREIK